MNFTQAQTFLEGLINFERTPLTRATRVQIGLGRVRDFLARLGDPHRACPVIHIAGTKGKGSTAAMMSAILKAAGYRVGMYTSPHLADVRERIRVDGCMITQSDFAEIISQLEPHLDEMRQDATSDSLVHRRATYFELMTHAAFLYFAQQKVDIAVVEVGLGGTLDATNVVDPLLCAITRISLDHVGVLGDTLEVIARDKAGILKKGCPGVISKQVPEALAGISSVAERVGAPLVMAGELHLHSDGVHFDVQTDSEIYRNLECALLGAHQRANAAIAVTLAHLARSQFPAINEESVRQGLAETRWQGRLELVLNDPPTWFDGAHNRESIRAALDFIAERYPENSPVVVFGTAADKDIAGMIEELTRQKLDVVLTDSTNPRGTPIDLILAALEANMTTPPVLALEPEQALARAREMAGSNRPVLVTGSLYLVGFLLSRLNMLLST